MTDMRAAGPAHAPVLAAIHAEAFDVPWSERDFAALLADPGALCLVVVEVGAEDEPAGFVLCRATLDEAEVLTIAVRPAWRRRGLAARLLSAAGVALAGQGVATLFLEVAEDNGPARALYDALGFTQVGLRKRYYARANGPAVDALVLSVPVPLGRATSGAAD